MARAFKISVGVCAGLILGMVFLFLLLMYLHHIDCFRQHADEAQRQVRNVLGSTATSNEYFVDFSFLQGVGPQYFRCDTTSEAVEACVKRMGLSPVSDSQTIQAFRNGLPYWWNPRRGKDVEYYGIEGKQCVISFDKQTGRCYIRRYG
ncbi:MAG: hypothetical protein FWH21_07445 [Kiritimatiellaeota bacterium]|nr:hypothetical protein [Kiritimatiellota bacterium]